MSERSEAWMRIVVAIVSGIILSVWKTLIQVLIVVHWILVIFTGKRNKGLAQFSEIWNTQVYSFLRYITFVTNERPFPFTPLVKNMSKFGK
ncbi:DUF4389 domain-containing protein [Candidatus Woesearchaeota archaeon]|jgi:hypothetical protein|nr:DUF4389 domain-containing protein [Candidatus Woesearchaeota archaeon]MBT4151019.1 DUF4389 domain-containing protein [Candidatus Woesearchaeota archaeon]MBT4247212.1 DUF4389 domain-containing protein [Candidatus Woesearchaeota archaeon]MBT4433809.1 DUF4389 domain-containing protein [Candidatus Woesearchaeota archaeon]MBT7332192.1 DUF4389 domain-containing protein [Candidatus Woesearchaeota archaeon]